MSRWGGNTGAGAPLRARGDALRLIPFLELGRMGTHLCKAGSCDAVSTYRCTRIHLLMNILSRPAYPAYKPPHDSVERSYLCNVELRVAKAMVLCHQVALESVVQCPNTFIFIAISTSQDQCSTGCCVAPWQPIAACNSIYRRLLINLRLVETCVG
jgi:hypothetical protein